MMGYCLKQSCLISIFMRTSQRILVNQSFNFKNDMLYVNTIGRNSMEYPFFFFVTETFLVSRSIHKMFSVLFGGH